MVARSKFAARVLSSLSRRLSCPSRPTLKKSRKPASLQAQQQQCSSSSSRRDQESEEEASTGAG